MSGKKDEPRDTRGSLAQVSLKGLPDKKPPLLSENESGGSMSHTVYDLRGPATSMGASYGALGYVGVDAISFSPNKDLSMANGIDGWQVTLGYGIGIDIHVMRTITESLIKTQKTYSQDKMTILKVHQEKQLLYRNRGLAIKKMTK